MFSGVRKSLKVIDFYQAVPTEMSEGTVSGACISMVSIGVLIILTIYSFVNFNTPNVVSDLIIDQKHLSQKLKVNIDIEFPRYPCSFLSVDIENVLKTHLVNVQDNLQKIVLPDALQLYSDKGWGNDKRLQRVLQDIKEKKGCRVLGFIQIDRVPGNFHISSHGYSAIVPSLINQGFRNFDLSHKIHTLAFGDNPILTKKGINTLGGFNSQKEIDENFMGITYTYFLDIIQHNEMYMNTQNFQEIYFYTARLNEVILPQFPMVLFKYQTNPMTVLEIYEFSQWHTFWIQFIGILGGIFTVSAIIDNMVHSSIRFLIDKHRQGKLI